VGSTYLCGSADGVLITSDFNVEVRSSWILSVMHLAMPSGIPCNSLFKALYQRLTASGKAKKSVSQRTDRIGLKTYARFKRGKKSDCTVSYITRRKHGGIASISVL